MNRNNLFIVLAFFLSGCTNAVSEQEYYDFVKNPENGLILTKSKGDLSVDCIYKPYDYVKMTTKNAALNDDYYDFELHFKTDKSNDFIKFCSNESLERYNIITQYLSYGMEPDVSLICGSDSIAGRIHFERTYGNRPFEKVLLSFKKENPTINSDLKVFWKDRVFGFSNIEFVFKKSEIDKIPKLKTNI